MVEGRREGGFLAEVEGIHKENAPFLVSENEEIDSPDKWAKHCVENTNGCRLHENVLYFLADISNSDCVLKDLYDYLKSSPNYSGYVNCFYGNPNVFLVTKGYGTEKEEYSAFSRFLEIEKDLLEEYKDTLFNSDLYIFCGEALDYCVYNSIKDFINLVKEYDDDIVNKIIVSTRYSSPIGSMAGIKKLYRELGIELTNKSFEEMIVDERGE